VKRINSFTIEWILSISKVINNNGCWIPQHKADEDGYIRITFGRYPKAKRYKLHRIVMCVYNNIDYDNKSVESRHSTRCSRACFNPEHIKPGSKSDNVKDSVKDKTHRNSAKITCPKCNGSYSLRTKYGKIVRFCRACNRAKKT